MSKACGMTLVATDLLVFPRRRRGFDFIIPFANGAVMCEAGEDMSSNQPEASVISSSSAVGGGGRVGSRSYSPNVEVLQEVDSSSLLADMYSDANISMNTTGSNLD